MNNYKKKQEDLFKEWQTKLKKNKDEIFEDGITNIEKWNEQKPKIMFLLKEPYSKFSIYNINSRKGSGPNFWQNILLWKNLVSEKYNEFLTKDINNDFVFPDYRKFYDWKNKTISPIAYVNIKKTYGKSKSNYKTINKFAYNNKELLRKQIDMINPDIIFTDVATYNSYKKIYEYKNYDALDNSKIIDKKNGKPYLYKHNNRLIIYFYHPGFWSLKRKVMYQSLSNKLTSEVFSNFKW